MWSRENYYFSDIFRLFNPRVGRILEEMNDFLHPELIGDSFPRKDHSLIKVFGFIGAPLILPVFLTSNIFSLELRRQRLQAYIKHFIAPKLKKISWIKYSVNVGHYIFKKEAT